MRYVCWGLLSGLLVGITTQVAHAGFIRHDRTVTPYNQLALRPEFAAAGFVFHPSVGFWHTGTLVAPNVVLTAAHAFDPDGVGAVTRDTEGVFFGHHHNPPFETDRFYIKKVILHPKWPNPAPQHDLALLFLDRSVKDVAPVRIATINPQGLKGVSVGYGIQGDGLGHELTDANPRLAFEVSIDYVGPEDGLLLNHFGLDPEFAEQIGVTIRSDFDHPDGLTNSYGDEFPLDLEGGSETGDSGGPLYIQDGSGWAVAGVLFGGFNPYDDIGYGKVNMWAPLYLEENQRFIRDHSVEIIPEPTGLALAMLAAGLGLCLFRRCGRPAADAMSASS